MQTLQHIFMQHSDKEMHLPYWNTGSSLPCKHSCISSGLLCYFFGIFARKQHSEKQRNILHSTEPQIGMCKDWAKPSSVLVLSWHRSQFPQTSRKPTLSETQNSKKLRYCHSLQEMEAKKSVMGTTTETFCSVASCEPIQCYLPKMSLPTSPHNLYIMSLNREKGFLSYLTNCTNAAEINMLGH